MTIHEVVVPDSKNDIQVQMTMDSVFSIPFTYHKQTNRQISIDILPMHSRPKKNIQS